MDSSLSILSSVTASIGTSSTTNKTHLQRTSWFACQGRLSFHRMRAISNNGAFSCSCANSLPSSSVEDVHRRRSSFESLFCYDKAIPEEIIEKPIGLSLSEKMIGDNPRCPDCQAKGAVLCSTCTGSGLYVDSILESQGIIVKVRCLGCGGTGNIMCSGCGGRGHLGFK